MIAERMENNIDIYTMYHRKAHKFGKQVSISTSVALSYFNISLFWQQSLCDWLVYVSRELQ